MRTALNTDTAISSDPVSRRRHRSKEERRQIVEESLQPGTSVAVVARRHGVNANQVFHWRKLLSEGRLEPRPASSQLLPVRISDIGEQRKPARSYTGTISIEVGRVRVHVEGSVDPESLRTILAHLGQ